MSLTYQLIIALLITVVASVLISARRIYNLDSVFAFVWGNQEVKTSQCANLLASTAFAMTGILYFLWLGYAVGYAALLLQVFFCASYILLMHKAPLIKKRARYGSLHGSIGETFGPKTALIAAIASVAGFVLILGWELSVGATIFLTLGKGNVALETILHLSFMIGIGIIVAFYTGGGGLRGNIYANILQNILAFIAMILAIYLLSQQYNISIPFRDQGTLERLFKVVGTAAVISNMIFSVIWQFVDMSAWQNIAATEGEGKKQKASLALGCLKTPFSGHF